MNHNTRWQTKLAARIHDPAEKALVLMRDPAGHEGGSIVGIGKALGFNTHWVTRRDGSKVEKLRLLPDLHRVIEQADHWAAAADRAQFPKDANERFVSWAQVRFAEQGELIHPLSGQRYKVYDVGQDVLASHIRTSSEDLFKQLIQTSATGEPDHCLTSFAFWRFGPELGSELEGIGHLWSLLPADTRTPDHTIWQHLDLTSALAGTLTDGGRPALLTVWLGPVQDFIAAGRSTSDLWAGSHFLSTLAWQAMKIIAEAFGPDAILFPQLRGVPMVDLWLIQQGLNRDLFKNCEWNDTNTDYNPLFGAALPNKFVAIVPENEGEQLAIRIVTNVREWVRCEARAMLDQVLSVIGETPGDQHCCTQLEQQLREFPEVYWSLVPWYPQGELEPTLAEFYPKGSKRPGFFGSPAWDILKAPIEPDQGWRFWEPNGGALYPAVYDAAERLLAAAKSVRGFEQLPQTGYRDSLTGECEWLTLDENELDLRPGQRTSTLWARGSERKASWVKKGEHLSAVGLLKRLWPTRYVEWLKEQGITSDVNRYVVSTHVMALAPSLEKLMRDGPANEQAFQALAAQTAGLERVALPRRLMQREYRVNKQWWETASRLPTLIEDIRERTGDEQEEGQIEAIGRTIEDAIGVPSERYYALLLMDGDKLGAWLSGQRTLKFHACFHSSVRAGLERYRDDNLKRYLDLDRPTSPASHMAISSALNGFTLDLVRHVVEDLCLGKLLYSGGDDVMAMVCVRDLLRVLWLLRLAYSGGMPGQAGDALFHHDLDLKRGFVQWRGRLYRVMGESATASVGAVIAHHMAPLGAVLGSLREAERSAKGNGGRNAFSIRIIKRSGGRLDLTLPWWLSDRGDAASTMHALESLRGNIAKDMSRRVAYHADEWVRRFPWLAEPGALKDLIARNLEYQFGRKGWKGGDDPVRIAEVAVREAQRRTTGIGEPAAMPREAYAVVQAMLFTTEFLARESRGSEERVKENLERETVHG
ncbi:MAG: type III-B CRISPR-associated protein Cas10/Cmr2 [Acidobacteria bacterium]|nr:type III-B CRISPR-associated protein Cas10/Cmr2 [Acidobacteriota bacterium]